MAETMKPKAMFVWWCRLPSGPAPFYHIFDPDQQLGKGYHMSTVTDQTLTQLGIEVPPTPKHGYST